MRAIARHRAWPGRLTGVIGLACALVTIAQLVQPGGRVVPPFVTRELLVVSLAAALPLAMAVASWLVRLPYRPFLPVLISLIPTALIGWKPFEAQSVDMPAAGLAMLRAGMASALLLPIVVSLVSFGSVYGNIKCARLWLVSLSAVISVVAPALFATDQADKLSALATEAVRTKRTAQALTYLDQLRGLGLKRTVAGRPADSVAQELQGEARAMNMFVKRTVESSEPDIRLRRAEYLARLNRHEEAEAILQPLAATSIDARLLLAASAQARGQYQQSSAAYRSVWDEALSIRDRILDPSRKQSDAKADQLILDRAFVACQRAADGLGYNAIQEGKWAEAETAYRMALAELPGTSSHYLFRLGALCRDQGDSFRALRLLEQSLEGLPASERAEAERLLNDLRTQTPACLLRLTSRDRSVSVESP